MVNVVGTLPIEHSVDDNGSLTLQIPIQLPPAKFTPSFSFSYHSAAGDISLGPGWLIKGVASVERVPATICQDGFRGSINYNSYDRFAINGQRIVQIGTSNEYRYEVEQWSKITAFGSDAANPDYWVERFPDGSVRIFGSTSDSNIKACGGSATRVWAVSKFTDAFTNYISFSYLNDTKGGSHYLTSIAYGGNTTLNVAHQRRVLFTYQQRPDIRIRYLGGFKITHDQRLVSITASVDEKTAYTYTLEYDTARLSAKGRLSTITLSDPDGHCIEPLRFSWTDGKPQAFNDLKSLEELPTKNASGAVMILDVNANGKSDIVVTTKRNYNLYLEVYLAGEDGVVSTTPATGSGDTGLKFPTYFFPIEAYGQGRTDLLHIREVLKGTVHEHILTLLRSTPDGYKAQTSITFKPESSSGKYFTGDFEGNGCVGLVYVYTKSNKLYFVQFTPDNDQFKAQSPAEGPSNISMETLHVVVADMNGNGMDDLFLVTPVTSSSNKHYCRIRLIESTQGVLKYRKDDPLGEVGKAVKWTDSSAFLPYQVDEDGKTGLLSISKASNKLQYQILRSTGPSLLTSSPPIATSILYDGDVTLSKVTTQDTADVVSVVKTTSGTKVGLLRFHNDGLVEVIEVKQPPKDELKGYFFRTADLRGIGRIDLLFMKYNSSNNLQLSTLSCEAARPIDYISSFVNGLGATVSVTYASLCNSRVYTTSANSTTAALNAHSRNISSTVALSSSGPVPKTSTWNRGFLVILPRYVVSELNGCSQPAMYPDQIYRASYSYQDARLAFDGRGWLGFNTIVKTELPVGTTTTTTYLQTFPFTGRVSQVLISETTSSRRILELTYNWASAPSNDGRIFLAMPSLMERQYEGGNLAYQVDVTHIYDSFGNVTKTTMSAPLLGRPTMTIKKTYINNTDDWVIGAKTQEEIDPGDGDPRSVQLKYLTKTLVPCERSLQVSASQWLTQSFQYDGAGNETLILGPGPAKHLRTYDSYSFLVSSTAFVNATATLVKKTIYDKVHGQPAFTTDENGHIIAHTYDILGRISQISEGDAQDKMVVLERHSSGSNAQGRFFLKETRCDWAADSWMREVTYVDGAGHIWRVEKPKPSSTTAVDLVCKDRQYDGAGRILRKSMPYIAGTTPQYIELTYDTHSRPLVVISPAAVDGMDRVAVTYDYAFENGKLLVRESGLQSNRSRTRIIQYFPNPDPSAHDLVRACVVGTIDELGQQIVRTYNAFGDVTSITDPAGVQMTFAFDRLSRQIERCVSCPNGTSSYRAISHFTVTNDDALCLTTIHNQQTNIDLVVQKDYLDRIVSKRTPDEVIEYTYDNGGLNSKHRLVSTKSSKGIENCFDYNTQGCVVSSTISIDGQSFSTKYTWTPTKQLLSIKNPDGSTITRSYYMNSNSLCKVVLNDSTEVAVAACSFDSYNAFFEPTLCSFANGLVSKLTCLLSGLPTSAALTKGNDTVLQQKWMYDDRGRIGSYNLSSGANDNQGIKHEFGYDIVDQLSLQTRKSGDSSDLSTHGFAYDQSGNLAVKGSKKFVIDGWQVSAMTDLSGNIEQTFDYSTSGSITQKKDSSGNPLCSMQYDSEERLVGVNGISFTYDFSGRLVKAKREDGSTTFYPSNSFEIDISPEGFKSYSSYLVCHGRRAVLFTLLPDTPEETTSINYFHCDHLGSTIAVSDVDGRITTTYEYDVFGNVTCQGVDSSRYKYSGKEMFSGLYYFGARFFDPEIGRFVSLDNYPIHLEKIHRPSILNQYSFSCNDPINFIDLNGNEGTDWFALFWHLGVETALLTVGIILLFGPGTQSASAAILLEVGGEVLIGAGLSGFQSDLGELSNDDPKFNNLAWLAEVVVGGVFGAVDFGVGKALDKVFPAVVALELSVARSRGARAVISGPIKKVIGRSAVYTGTGALRGGATQIGGNLAEGKDVFHNIQYGVLYGAVTGGLKGVGEWQKLAKLWKEPSIPSAPMAQIEELNSTSIPSRIPELKVQKAPERRWSINVEWTDEFAYSIERL